MRITITDDSIQCKPKMNSSNLIGVLFSAIVGTIENVVKQAPEEDQQKLRDAYYDLVNVVASEALTCISPERELRPDLTADAIVKAENELIEKMKEHAMS